MLPSSRAVLTFALALVAAVTAPDGVRANGFNGEILLAPPPATWSGGTARRDTERTVREWTRTYPDSGRFTETIRVVEFPGLANKNAAAEARERIARDTGDCKPSTPPTPLILRKAGYASARYSADCTTTGRDKKPAIRFSMVEVLAGEFNLYVVERRWQGDPSDPAMPTASPRVMAAWTGYFDQIRVCNTLSNPCDPADLTMIHSHPRFTTMRKAPVVSKPVLAPDKSIKAASGFGELTGRAEACKEDVKGLLGRVSQIFENVTANDAERSKALAAFDTARSKGRAEQTKAGDANCGSVLRDFREHPVRIGVFHRYLERFL